MSKSSFYYYFANKDDLYGTVVGDGLSRLLAAMGTLGPVRTPADYWAGWVRMYQGFLGCQLQDPILARLNWSAIQARARGGAHPALERLAAQMYAWLEALLRTGQEVGAVRRDVPHGILLHAIFGMLEGGDRWLAESWSDITPERIDELARSVVTLLRSLASPDHDSPGLEVLSH